MHSYNISGMSCSGCVATVKNKLSSVFGVTSVKVDLGKKQAEITSSQEITIDILQDALRNTSYTITKLVT
ncbi:MAG: heavy metal-associated domain-containing protein [bacterium]|nr:heavy metal-associated domain-containing protein [bacterium]